MQFKLTQCIAGEKITIEIMHAGQTGPDRAGQCGPGPGRAEPNRVGHGAGMGNWTGMSKDGRGKVGQCRTGPDNDEQGRTGMGRTGSNSTGQSWAGRETVPGNVRQGQTGPSRARYDHEGQK